LLFEKLQPWREKVRLDFENNEMERNYFERSFEGDFRRPLFCMSKSNMQSSILASIPQRSSSSPQYHIIVV